MHMGNDDKDRIRQAFATRFRKALTELGYMPNEQQVMRRIFGVSGQAVRKWAEGEALPTSSRIPQVAAILGVRRAWLQDGEEPMRPLADKVAEQKRAYGTKPDQELALSQEEIRLLLQYRNLAPQQKNAIREIVALFAKPSRKQRT